MMGKITNYSFFHVTIFRFFGLLTILTFALTSCQTLQPKSEHDKAARILESQKALVRSSLDSSRPEAALQQLRPLLVKYPKDAGLHNLMGLAQLALKNPSRAIRHFRSAYKLDQAPAAALNLSSAYIEAGQYKGATALLKTMLKQQGDKAYPMKERIYHNLGYANLRQKNNKAAIHWFGEALAENPSFFPSHMELARLYEAKGRAKLARSSYGKALNYCEVCFDPIYAITMIDLKTGYAARASHLVRQYLKNPKLTEHDRRRARNLLNFTATASLPSAPSKG